MTISDMSPAYQFDAFDRGYGTGSGDVEQDWIDEHSTAHQNEWSSGMTKFYANEAPPDKRQKYKRLKKWHERIDDEHNRSAQLRQTKIHKDAKTFAVICDLTDQQRERVLSIISTADIASNTYGGKSYEKIILAIMSLVVDETISNPENIDDRLILQDDFRQLMDTIGLSSSELRTVRQQVRERTQFF